MLPSNTAKQGTLTIAGTGITSVGQITLETLSHIKESDRIYYVVTDPATEAFILDNCNSTASCCNVLGLFRPDTDRDVSYVQICEMMLRKVREGHAVLGLFYGHPGVFVTQSHRAIAMAQAEGFEARMLPGVSAEDCLVADLGFAPTAFGCSNFEATELLARERRLDPTTHNIIWQVGVIGISNMSFNNDRFGLLVDRLNEDFGPEHKVVHYISAVLPQSETTIDTFTISDLRKEEVVTQFNSNSILYIPPRDSMPIVDSIAAKLGLVSKITSNEQRYSLPTWLGSRLSATPTYSAREREALVGLDSLKVPQQVRVLHASPVMRQFMAELAQSPKLQKRYRADPDAVVKAVQGLTPAEAHALALNKDSAIRVAMTATEEDIAQGRDQTTQAIDDASGISVGTYTIVFF